MENATLCTPQKKPTGMDDHDWNDGGFLQVQVCGAPVISSTRNKVSEYLIGYLKKPFDCCRNLFFLNAHGMSFLFAHPTFAEALEDASWILNDGLGMDMAAWLMGRRFQENLNGSDLVDEGPLLAACATEGIGVYILGGHQVVVERAALVYKQRFPGLRIVGVHHGYFAHDSGEASADIVARVNESGAELLLVGMGNPVQEVWLARHRDQLRCKLAIGVGGVHRSGGRSCAASSGDLDSLPSRMVVQALPGAGTIVAAVSGGWAGLSDTSPPAPPQLVQRRDGGLFMQVTQLIRLGWQRAVQELRENAYLKTGLDLTRPYAIRGLLTRRCNHHCPFCGDWRQDGFPDEMTADEWCTALESLKRFIGRYTVQFSGGEPSLHPGFFEVLEFCRERGIGAGVVSNGSFLKGEKLERFVQARPTSLDISVDGPDSALHDMSRNTMGSFETIESGIRRLRMIMQDEGRVFPIRIKTTVHRKNFRALPQLVTWSKRCGAATISFQPVRRWTPEVAKKFWLEEEELNDLAQVVETLIALRKAGAAHRNAAREDGGLAGVFSARDYRSGCSSVPGRPGGLSHSGQRRCHDVLVAESDRQRQASGGVEYLGRRIGALVASRHSGMPEIRARGLRPFLLGAPPLQGGGQARADGPSRSAPEDR